jgi:hypothetical protein
MRRDAILGLVGNLRFVNHASDLSEWIFLKVLVSVLLSGTLAHGQKAAH